jgi:hypothetical protein
VGGVERQREAVVERAIRNDNEMIGFDGRLVLEDAVFANADVSLSSRTVRAPSDRLIAQEAHGVSD